MKYFKINLNGRKFIFDIENESTNLKIHDTGIDVVTNGLITNDISIIYSKYPIELNKSKICLMDDVTLYKINNSNKKNLTHLIINKDIWDKKREINEDEFKRCLWNITEQLIEKSLLKSIKDNFPAFTLIPLGETITKNTFVNFFGMDEIRQLQSNIIEELDYNNKVKNSMGK